MKRQFRAPYAASVGALIFFWLALTPSLLPRDPIFQGIVCATAAILGYGIGALFGWVVRSCGGRLAGGPRRVLWRITGVIALVGTPLALWAYLRWENSLRNMVGVEDKGFGALVLTLVVALLLFIIFLTIARVLKGAGHIVVPVILSEARSGGSCRLGRRPSWAGLSWRSGPMC